MFGTTQIEGMVTLKIQDPTDDSSDRLLDALLVQTESATIGGAAFAWATAEGVDMLIRNERFESFLTKGKGRFELIVGVDFTTTPAALTALEKAQSDLDGLQVSVFLTPKGAGIFHPKIAWFGGGKGGSLVAGSGNMTIRGLKLSWEAFSLTQLSEPDLAGVQGVWKKWLDANSARLVPVTSTEAIRRAEENLRLTKQLRAAKKTESQAPLVSMPTLKSELLITATPIGKNRPGQASFRKHIMSDYFGVKQGQKPTILFRALNQDGSLGRIETRQPITKKNSGNWSFELDQAHGWKKLENDKRYPVGVFLKVAEKAYLYYIVHPDAPYHRPIAEYLAEHGVVKGNSHPAVPPKDDASQVDCEFVRRILAVRAESFSDDEIA